MSCYVTLRLDVSKLIDNLGVILLPSVQRAKKAKSKLKDKKLENPMKAAENESHTTCATLFMEKQYFRISIDLKMLTQI